MRIAVVGLLRVKTQDVEALERDSDRNGWFAQGEGKCAQVLERDSETGIRIGMVSLLRVKAGCPGTRVRR